MYLKSPVLGLRNEQPDDKGLNRTPDGKDNVKPPLDILQSNGVGELVDHHSNRQGQIREGHSLGTDLEGQNLDGVQSLEGRDTEGVDGVEDEDKGHECVASGTGTCLLLHGDGNNGGGPDEGDAAECTDHHRTTTKFVNKESTGNSLSMVSTIMYNFKRTTYEGQLHARLAQVDVHLLDLLSDTSALKDTI